MSRIRTDYSIYRTWNFGISASWSAQLIIMPFLSTTVWGDEMHIVCALWRRQLCSRLCFFLEFIPPPRCRVEQSLQYCLKSTSMLTTRMMKKGTRKLKQRYAYWDLQTLEGRRWLHARSLRAVLQACLLEVLGVECSCHGHVALVCVWTYPPWSKQHGERTVMHLWWNGSWRSEASDIGSICWELFHQLMRKVNGQITLKLWAPRSMHWQHLKVTI